MIKKKMMMGASLMIMTFSFCGNSCAQSCTKVPTCDELGYVGTSCPEGTASLKCPFDQSKVFCAKDCEGFTLTSCPANATCSQCWNGKYKKLSCKAGYVANGDICEVKPCEGYNLTSQNVTNCSYYGECQSGPTMKYSCYTCEKGYEPNASYDACVAARCTTASYAGHTAYLYYPEENLILTSQSDPNCEAYNTCQSGNITYYFCTSCKSKYIEPLNIYKTSATFTGKCILSSEVDCPTSKGWRSYTGYDSHASSYHTCYVGNYSVSGDYSNRRYRVSSCQSGYKINTTNWTCEKE